MIPKRRPLPEQADLLRSFPRIMGIVNVNDDSFSGDGTLDISEALELAAEMIRDGADIIDVGAESARTNREAISEAEEIDRLTPFLENLPKIVKETKPRDNKQIWPPLVSVNTWRTEVVKAVLETGGVDIINDISGLKAKANAELCAEHGAILLIMHTVGNPKVPHFEQSYDDVLSTVEQFFEEKIALAKSAGLSNHQIILDPGIDFAKQKEDNLVLFRNLERFTNFDLPVLLPISRKTVIGDVLCQENPIDRDAGTIACLARGICAGVDIFRVHNVKAAAESARVLAAIEDVQ